MAGKFYKLPELPYAYNALEPHISEEQLRLHHDKHHQAYVDASNAILKLMDESREKGKDFDIKAKAKELSFNMGGHQLHNLFWKNIGPADKCGGEPTGKIAEYIEKDFGSFERFKKEFSQTAISAEGSGWAVLVMCKNTDRLFNMQYEKHNVNLVPKWTPLLVLDVWEHAYYIDYKNVRPDFVEAFWNIVNWDEVNNRLQNWMNCK
ncbi:superoxide dismutase [Methanobacterium sp. ACI-7]|uniref:superoxide dismutase n=1 Tax=unclassified Methanobacterium TaxID=2627676 RepID=UPI0039C38364